MSAEEASSDAHVPIIDLPPPSATVRASVEQFVIAVIARGVLVDLGLLPSPEEFKEYLE